MFPFDLSFQDIFIFGVVVTVAGGYKEQFLRYSRQGGVFVGRAVGFIRQKRDQVFTSTAQKQEIEALQHQLSDAMAQMQFIRHDIRSSTRMSRAYMSQGGDEAAAAPSHQGGAAVQVKSAPVLSSNGDVSMPFQASNPLSIPHSGSGTTDSASSGRMDAHGGTRTSHVHSSDNVQPEQEELPTGQAHARPRLPAAQRPEAAFAAVSDNRVEDSQSKDETTYGTLRTASPTIEAKSARDRFSSLDVGGDSGKVVYIDGVPLIPVSAADTGKLPKREGPVTGSDIMEEALLEAQVARQAAAFIRGPPTE